MSLSGLAGWIAPITQQLEQSRREVCETAARISDETWNKASDYSGWSYRDQLSHLGASHQDIHSVLRPILDGNDPDFARFARINEINEENRQKHVSTTVEELISTFSAASTETQRIMSQLTPEHADYRLGPMTLSQALQGFSVHDQQHLAELRKALAA